jgi:selenocysteine lyase/cysteine desulfurase
VPQRLRKLLGRVLGANEDDVVLANSASYGLHLVANGLDLRRGDEIIVAANDFPSDILPWLRLQEGGVKVRMLEPNGAVLTADEVEAALTRRTRAVCLTWVHSFSGCVLDLDAVGAVCREHGAWFTSTDRKQSAHVRSTSERRRSTPSSVPASNGSAARTERGCAGCDPSCSTRFARPSSTGSAR